MTLAIPSIFGGAQLDFDAEGKESVLRKEVDIPIGTILAWAKSLGGGQSLIGTGWVQCDGQVLNDPESTLHGVTMPSLNSANRFLRGNTTSGGTGGSTTHTHDTENTRGVNVGASYNAGAAVSHLPPYYDVVWIIKVKQAWEGAT